jgi:mannose-6-phosphate isomerase-like protein (cupin superfamily)/ketosteroid isomerase-like protein
MRAARLMAALSWILTVGCVSMQSGSTSSLAPDVRAQILALEQTRCQAITAGDVKTLSAMLADDYVHVHGTGKIDTKAGFLANIQQNPRRTERGPLTIRLYGDTAVVTGEQLNYAQAGTSAPVSASVTQVLRRVPGRWVYESFQLTPRSADAVASAGGGATSVQNASSNMSNNRALYFPNPEIQSIWNDLEARQVINKRVLDGGSYSINVRIVRPGDAPLVHARSVDVWVVTGGSATAVTGGELVEPKQRSQPDDFAGTSIRGGTEQPLRAGDIVFVPTGVPHGFKDVQGFRAFLIRFDVK